jgi:iron complex outermembrane recepter protein
MRALTFLSASVALASLVAIPGHAASPNADRGYDLPAGPVSQSLSSIGRLSGVEIMFTPQSVAGLQAPQVRGTLSPLAAVRAALAGTELSADEKDGAILIRGRSEASASAGDADAEITVTGTRIRGAGPIGSPVTVVTREDLEKSGRATVADMVQTLPQNFGGGPNEGGYGTNVRNGAGNNRSYGQSINLRGLGTQSTLVLFDGNRPALGGSNGAFVDTSLIPSTALDRIEILTDGASAIYGTDAVAGVVNIRFRNRLDGLETKIFSGTAGGDYQQRQIAQAAGKVWFTGNIMFAYQYDHHSRLAGADREAATSDLRRFGGPNNNSDYTVPGNITAANGAIFSIPSGQDGRNLTAGELSPGVEHLVDQRYYNDLLPDQTTHSVYVAVNQKIGARVTAYVRALYAHRKFSIVNDLYGENSVSVPSSNPFYVDPIGTGQPVDIHYDFTKEVGLQLNPGKVTALTTSGGFKGSIGSWNIEAAASYGRQIERNRQLNGVSPDRVAIAVADTNPATALNVFGDGTANNPATIDAIRAEDRTYGTYRVWSTNLRADGTLVRLPAGSVKLAAGAEHRDERFFGYTDRTYHTSIPTHMVLDGTPGHRNIDALYAELSVPILGPQTERLPGRLDLSIAARTDWYSDVGRTTNPKVGLRWEPVGGLSLRASYGTSFRAPSFTEAIGSANNVTYPLTIPDPQSSTGQTAVITLDGTSAGLKPERATSWTAGFDLGPRAVPGLAVKGTYFNIDYRDRIGTATYDYTQFLLKPEAYGSLTVRNPSPATVAALYASDQFINPFAIPAQQIGAIINLLTLNLSRTEIRGFDFDLSYRHSLLGGTADLGVDGTRLLAIDQRITASAPAQNIVGTFYNPVKLRLRGNAGWEKDGLAVSAMLNYTGGYTNQVVIPEEHVRSWVTVDSQIGYRFDNSSPLSGVRLALSITNLFNRSPPYIQNVLTYRTMAYDPGQASAIGRLISFQASLSW